MKQIFGRMKIKSINKLSGQDQQSETRQQDILYLMGKKCQAFKRKKNTGEEQGERIEFAKQEK